MYKIKVTHTAPTFKQFEEWGVQQAYPKFYVNITFHDNDDKEVLMFKVKIEGDYYCSGSRNFEIEKTVLVDYKINNNISIEQVRELLLDDNNEKVVKESIKGSMIERDPMTIVEALEDFE